MKLLDRSFSSGISSVARLKPEKAGEPGRFADRPDDINVMREKTPHGSRARTPLHCGWLFAFGLATVAPAYAAPITQGGGDAGQGVLENPTRGIGGTGGVGGGGGGGSRSGAGGDGAQIDQPASAGEDGESDEFGAGGVGGAPGCAPNCDAADVDLSAGGGGGGGDGSYLESFRGDGGAGGAGGSGTIRMGDVTLDQDVVGGDGADADFSDDLFDVGGGGGGGAGLILDGDEATLQTEGHAVTGGAGGDGSNGGGGGAGVVATDGGGIIVDADGSITGGAGGLGSSSGDGGAGAFLLNGGALDNAGDITGGAGGSGGPLPGGDGGAGLLSNNGAVTNTGTITGGAGGAGGVNGGEEAYGSTLDSGDGGIGLRGYGGEIVNQAGATITGGDGGTSAADYQQFRSGDGGAGVSLTDEGGGTLTNFGAIAGGNGGTANVVGTGGVGVDVADDGVRVINGGTIAGGLDGDGSTRADALHLAGDDNALELRAGYEFVGDVVASGENATLTLGGNDDAGLNVGQIGAGEQYQGFTAFDKIGESTWTLSGTTTVVTPWTIKAGALAISRDANLGGASGGLTLAGGTLEITADGFSSDRDITLDTAGTVQVNTGTATWSGGIADGNSGQGRLTKTGDGNLTLTDANTYTGGTTVHAGGLIAEATGALGTGPVTIDGDNDQTLLRFDGENVSAQNLAITNTGGRLTFANGATAGSAVIENDTGAQFSTLLFSESSTAGDSQIGNDASLATFADASSADNATIVNTNGGATQFADSASAGDATITNGAGGGRTIFSDNATGEHATVINETGGDVDISRHSGALGIGSLSGAGDVHLGANALTLGGLEQDDTIGGVISDGGLAGGAGGSLVKTGEATLTLGGTNTYTGGTTIAAGTLAVSDDANLGAAGGLTFTGGTLDITADGFASARAVTLDTAGTVQVDTGNATLAGVLADGGGAGSLTKTGDGTLNLTGANTYSGGTTIAAGTLRGTTASLQGDIVDDAALVFDQTGAGTYAGSLSGAGTVAFTGGAIYALTGDSGGFAGASTVAGSTLTIDGALGGSLNIAQGSRLQGTGTVGDTTIADGGTIAPGNSIGTLHVDGDVTFDAGSRYEVEVQPGGTDSDLILATGSAIIDGGAVAHIGLDGDYAPNARYTIITADQGVTGTFDELTSDFAFLDPFLDYDPNDVYLVLQRNDTDFVDTTRTPNQHETADGTEPLGPGNPIYDSVVKLPEPEAPDAFDRLSGEIHATTQTALIQDSRYLRQAMLQRMRVAAGVDPESSESSAGNASAAGADLDSGTWVRAIGAFGGTDGDGNAAELDRSTRGVLFGGDTQVADYWRVGATGGFTRSGFDVDARQSTGHSDNFHGGLYAGTQNTPVRFTLGAGYTWHTIDTQRSVAFRDFSDRLQSSHQAGTTQVFGELGYALELGAATVEPFVNGIYVNLDNDGFTEHGGSAALRVEGEDTDITFSTLGLRTAGTVDLAGTTIALHGSAGWRHAYGDTTPTVTNAYAGGGPAFTVAGLPIEDDSAIVDAGMGVDIGDNATLGISYGGLFGSDTHDNAGKIDVTVRF